MNEKKKLKNTSKNVIIIHGPMSKVRGPEVVPGPEFRTPAIQDCLELEQFRVIKQKYMKHVNDYPIF